MRHLKGVITLVITGCIGLSLAGCETYGEAGGGGAVLGAIVGGVVGHQSGSALEGAAIGAVLGGASGLVAHDVKVQKSKNRQETTLGYEYRPEQGETMTFEEATLLPSVTMPGKMIEATFQYALLGTNGGTQVTETRKLLRGDRLVAELSSRTFTRDDGTWLSTQQFKLPSNLSSGAYTLVQQARTRQSVISGRSDFAIE